MPTVLLLNGPNLNLLRIHEQEINGSMNLSGLEEQVSAVLNEHKIECETFQSNSEGELIDWLHPDFAEWNIESCLPKIMVPQLVIQGNDDEYGTSAQVEAIVRQSGSIVETRFLDNCGHSPHRDQETQTLEFMTQFVRNLLDR